MTSAIWPGNVMPNSVRSRLNGITAKAISAGTRTMIGAAVNTHLSARAGVMSSLMKSFSTSAIGWRMPVVPHAHRPEPHLHPGLHLALEQHDVHHGGQHRDDHHDDLDQRDDDGFNHVSVSVRGPAYANRPRGRLRRGRLCLLPLASRLRQSASRPASARQALAPCPRPSPLPIHFPEHDVDGADERHDVRHQVPLARAAAAPAGCRTTAGARGTGTATATCRRSR